MQPLAKNFRSRSSSLLGLVGDNSSMARALSIALRAAQIGNAPVLIEGEAGTGRETIARLIHARAFGNDDRRARPFVTLRCAVIPSSTLKQELFASHAREAHGGTLYLDDVDALSPSLQEQVMQFVSSVDKCSRSQRSRRSDGRSDIRLMATTRSSLLEKVRQGTFREDLFYRLSALPITLPPLRARGSDIIKLARLFLARFSREEGKIIEDISPKAIALLQSYSWPGNISELENTIFRATLLADSRIITENDLPQIAARISGAATNDQIVQTVPLPEREKILDRSTPDNIEDPSAVTLVNANGDVRPLEALEADIIHFAIKHYQGRLSEVSRRLGIGRSTLYRKLKAVNYDFQTQYSPALYLAKHK